MLLAKSAQSPPRTGGPAAPGKAHFRPRTERLQARTVLRCEGRIRREVAVMLRKGSARPPEMQGQGHGRRLLHALLKVARAHGVARVFLEVRPTNVHAIALYHDEGFNEIGRRPRYYPAKDGREDALALAMELLPLL